MSSTSVLLRYYVKELRRVLHGPAAALTFLFATLMHAVGHALMALVASALALSVATRWGGQARARGPLEVAGFGVSPAADAAFFLSLVGLGAVVVKGAAGVYATYVQVRVAGQIGCALRLDLLDALLCLHRLRQPRHDDQGADSAPTTGAVVALTDRVRDVEAGLARGWLASLRAVAQLLPIAAMLVVLSGRMAAAATVVLSAFGWTLGRLRSRYCQASARTSLEHERLHEAADDSVRHADLWVSYGAERKVRASVRRLGEALANGSAWLEARAATMSAANEVLAALALVGAMGASRMGLLGNVAGSATMLAFAVAFFLAYRPLRELADARLVMSRAEGAYEDLKRVVDRARACDDSSARDSPSAADRSWGSGPLEVRALGLSHGRCGPISMRVEHGAIAVVMGPTGVGKTTLLRTLLGLEATTSGDVLFDGERLSDAPAGPRSRPFAWVPQDAPLLADTLAANVTLGAPDADPLEVLAPLGATHLVASFEGARLGWGGRTLSGGERQWVALARAIATRQPVLLLDEPTSGLDENAQRVVLAAIERLRGRRTVILVTHRPEPLTIADVVVRLEERTAMGRAA